MFYQLNSAVRGQEKQQVDFARTQRLPFLTFSCCWTSAPKPQGLPGTISCLHPWGKAGSSPLCLYQVGHFESLALSFFYLTPLNSILPTAFYPQFNMHLLNHRAGWTCHETEREVQNVKGYSVQRPKDISSLEPRTIKCLAGTCESNIPVVIPPNAQWAENISSILFSCLLQSLKTI